MMDMLDLEVGIAALDLLAEGRAAEIEIGNCSARLGFSEARPSAVVSGRGNSSRPGPRCRQD
jgi:hypothetical protein